MKKQGFAGKKVMKVLQADKGYYMHYVNSLRMILSRNTFKFKNKYCQWSGIVLIVDRTWLLHV